MDSEQTLWCDLAATNAKTARTGQGAVQLIAKANGRLAPAVACCVPIRRDQNS